MNSKKKIIHFRIDNKYSKSRLNTFLKSKAETLNEFVYSAEQNSFLDNQIFGFCLNFQYYQDEKFRPIKIKLVFLENTLISISNGPTKEIISSLIGSNLRNTFNNCIKGYSEIIASITSRSKAFDRVMRKKNISPRPLNDMKDECFRIQNAVSNQIDILDDILNQNPQNEFQLIKELYKRLKKIYAHDISSTIKELEIRKDMYIFINNIKFSRSIHLLTTISVIMFPLHTISDSFSGPWWTYLNFAALGAILFHIVKFQINDKVLRDLG